MARRDYIGSYPSDMEEYLFSYGYHFNEKLFRFAVALMMGKDVDRVTPAEWAQVKGKDDVRQLLKNYGIDLKNNVGYDAAYVYAMAKSDFFRSSITDEQHLALFVKDYLDDKDGAESRAFDEFFAKTVALGIPIFWGDML